MPCVGGQGACGVRAGRADVARRCWSRSGRRSRRPCRAARTRRARCPRAPSPRRDSRTPDRGHSVRPPVPRRSRPLRPGSARSSHTRRAQRSRALGRARARGSDPADTGCTLGVVCPRRGARGPRSVTAAAGVAAANAAWQAPGRTAAAPLLRLALGACKATAPAPRPLIGPACTAGRPSARDRCRAALRASLTAGKSPEQLCHLQLSCGDGGDDVGEHPGPNDNLSTSLKCYDSQSSHQDALFYFILPSFQFCLVKGISSLRGQIFTNGWLDFPLSWNPSSSALLPEAALAIRFLGMFSGIFSACTTLGEHIAQSPHGKTPIDCTHDFALGFFCLQNFRFPTFYHH